jgi:hypothetical protein
MRIEARSDRLALVAYLSVFPLLIAAVIFATPTPAQAYPPESCIYGFGFNEEVTQGTQRGNHSGIRSDLSTFAYDNDCQRIVGTAVVSPGGGFVEYSWLLGWSSCNHTYHSQPKTFMWWVPDGGTNHCSLKAYINPGTWYQFTVKDTDGDTLWRAERNGNPVDTMDVNFDRGEVDALRERGNQSDNGFAHYKQLHWYLSGAAWYPWSDPVQRNDTDEQYTEVFVSPTEVKYVHV